MNSAKHTSVALTRSLAAQIYDAECALHAARQSGMDAWIKAAAERLHGLLVRAEFAQPEPVAA
jgi:hypothetical protein